MIDAPYTVLILDDEPHIGTVLTQLFELEGHCCQSQYQCSGYFALSQTQLVRRYHH